MGSGVDPHLFKPTRSDIALLNNADLILANGLLLEGKMGETFDRLAASGKKVVRVAESTPSGSTRRLGEHADPHVWMDPNLWSIAAVQMRDALIALMPAHKDEFESRARDVVADLARLNAYAAEAFATIPPTSRVLITAHDAFGYLGARYSIEVEGIQGISTESEAGLRDLERLATLIAQRKIRAVFVESTVSERTINSLAKAARDKGQDVIIGGSLFSDAIGKPGTYEGTYIGMIDHNVTTIVRALGGTAPERGMENKLAPSTQERKPGAGT
jgi:manganese/zinc/iron transport system substrate-binding protein